MAVVRVWCGEGVAVVRVWCCEGVAVVRYGVVKVWL